MSSTYDVYLRCGHMATFGTVTPEINDVVYCWPCDDYRQVVSARNPYITRCTKANCYIARSAEYDIAKAKLMKHAESRPSHKSILSYKGKVIGSYDGQTEGYKERFSIEEAREKQAESLHAVEGW